MRELLERRQDPHQEGSPEGCGGAARGPAQLQGCGALREGLPGAATPQPLRAACCDRLAQA